MRKVLLAALCLASCKDALYCEDRIKVLEDQLLYEKRSSQNALWASENYMYSLSECRKNLQMFAPTTTTTTLPKSRCCLSNNCYTPSSAGPYPTYQFSGDDRD